MTAPSRTVMQAARRLADANTDRLQAVASSRQVLATILTVTPGAASDGNALVTVTWRGASVTVSGYAASYSPVVGHRVMCDYVDNQLVVAYRVIGWP